MNWEQRIQVDRKILDGKPVIKGTRISVEFLLDLLAKGWSYEIVLESYPQIKKADIHAALKYAVEVLKEEKVYSMA